MIKKVLVLTLLVALLVILFIFRLELVAQTNQPTRSEETGVEATASSSEDYYYTYQRLNLQRVIRGLKNENVKVVMNERENLILLANDTQVYLLHIPSYEGRFITNVTDPSKLHSLSYYSQTDNIFSDDIHLYKLVGEDMVPLSIDSPEGLRYSLYLKGTNNVYYGNEMIKEADPSTFRLAASEPPRSAEEDSIPRMFYAKDVHHAYYKGKVVTGADATSFDVYKARYYEEYAHDAKNIYLNGELVSGADLNSFVILSDQPYEGCRLGMYAKDRNFVFYKTEKVEGADPATFEALWNEYGRDANHSYFEGKIIDNKPNELKVVCDYG